MHPEDPPGISSTRNVGDTSTRLEQECDDLRDQVKRLMDERNGCYGEWQHSKNQLEEIHQSKMWKLWMASIDLRRKIRHPLAFFKRAPTAEPLRETPDDRPAADRVVDTECEPVSPSSQETDLEAAADHDDGHPGTELTQTSSVDVSVVIPTLNGGEDLERCLEAICRQRTDRSFEVLCVDSGSTEDDLATMDRLGARIVPIERHQFNHGLTRDLGAGLTDGDTIVFLNQDAVPAHENWLEELVSPFDDGDERLAGIQGGMTEVDDLDQRFFWDSCGARFYFTSESHNWIADHGGIGFSTVNCAIRRSIWQHHPFGPAAIMEDKKWQRGITEAGFEIRMQQGALVHHTHNYTNRELLRRCSSEGTGWRALGEAYTIGDLTRDMFNRATWRELARGIRNRRIRTAGELFFPWLRPLALYWGNHFAGKVQL